MNHTRCMCIFEFSIHTADIQTHDHFMGILLLYHWANSSFLQIFLRTATNDTKETNFQRPIYQKTFLSIFQSNFSQRTISNPLFLLFYSFARFICWTYANVKYLQIVHLEREMTASYKYLTNQNKDLIEMAKLKGLWEFFFARHFEAQQKQNCISLSKKT